MRPFDLTRKALADLRAIAIFTEERWGNVGVKAAPEASRLERV
jgi:plasmid stabilization system protein ParE